MSGETVTIRPRVPADDDRIVAIFNRQEADSRPLSIDEYRQDANGSNGDWRYVAIRAGDVLGYAELRPAWWTGLPDVYMLELRVDRQYWGQGIGSALFDFLHREAHERGASRLLGWVRENVPEAGSFARHRGFTPTGELIDEYRLDLPSARLEEYVGIEEQLRGKVSTSHGLRSWAWRIKGCSEHCMRCGKTLPRRRRRCRLGPGRKVCWKGPGSHRSGTG